MTFTRFVWTGIKVGSLLIHRGSVEEKDGRNGGGRGCIIVPLVVGVVVDPLVLVYTSLSL